MKGVLTIAGVTLLLVACNQSDPCRPHKDEASCLADKACKWKAEKEKCKTAKKGEKSPQSKKTQHHLPQSRQHPQRSPPQALRRMPVIRRHQRTRSRSRPIQTASNDTKRGAY